MCVRLEGCVCSHCSSMHPRRPQSLAAVLARGTAEETPFQQVFLPSAFSSQHKRHLFQEASLTTWGPGTQTQVKLGS